MHRFCRLALAAIAAGGLLVTGAPARAQGDAQPLVLGANRILTLRSGDHLNGRDWSVQDRINHVQDVLPKHLGGPYGKLTAKKWGDRIHLYLNGDFILAVTPADARSTGYKSAEQLAPVWALALQRGFDRYRVWTRGTKEE